MLSIVVCALLMTVAIGVAQTMLLMRLTRNATVEQQRIEQMLLGQQASLATLMQNSQPVPSAPVAATAAPAPATPAPAPAVPRQPAADERAAAKSTHPHKHKAAAARPQH
jgi:hypothetical protein